MLQSIVLASRQALAGGDAAIGAWNLETVKLALIAGLFTFTLLCSLVPMMLRRLIKQRHGDRVHGGRAASVFGLLSCFGGGVFLGTSLLDLLPDTRQELSEYFKAIGLLDNQFPLAEFFTACGFTAILCIEQVAVHAKMMIKRVRGPVISGGTHEDDESGACSENRPLVRGSRATYAAIDDDQPEDIHEDPLTHSYLRAIILVATLSMHALFEGLALGLLERYSEVIQIFLALCIHKSLVAFSLGLRLISFKDMSNHAIGFSCLIFASVGSVGAVIGVILAESLHSQLAHIITGSLQGLACGTFLYIVTFEILPHELSTSTAHQIPAKLIFFIFGMATIAIVLCYGHS